MSPLVASFLRTALVPATVATVLIFALGSLRDPWRARLQALVFALAFVVGNSLLIGRLAFPPADVGESLSLAALVVALFVFIFPRAHEAPYLVRALFVVLLEALVLYHLGHALKSTVNTRNLLAFFFLGLGVWSIFERNVERVNLLTLIGLPLMTATGLSFILLFSASATLSQTVSILCTIAGGLLGVAVLTPGRLSRAAVAPFLSVFVIMLMIAGHFYLGVNPWKMVYLCIPYLFIWCRNWLKFIPSQPVIEFLILAALAAGPLGYFLYDAFKNAGPLY